MTTAREFALAAESLAGVRWRKHGRRPENGFDCGGLLVWALHLVGIEVEARRDYDAAMPPPDMLWNVCRQYGDESSFVDQGEGRVALCAWESGNPARHLSVMLGGRRIVHVDASVRRVVIVPASWLDQRLVAVFRVRGLDYGGSW